MTEPETRYQKYLARKRQKQANKTTQTEPRKTGSMASQIAQAANAPIHECLVPANLFERGIGNLVFSRSLPGGRMALAMFLLDVFCLGVKDTFFAVVGRDEYDRRLRSWRESESLQRIDPAGFRKLVEGGVVYARELGFNPSPDYVVVHKIFSDVEAAACPSHFQYGHAGKPFYISGPHETPTQVRTIVDQLQRRLGSANFEYLVLAP
jgi:hypothetical protein